jgi:hypothetical protein
VDRATEALVTMGPPVFSGLIQSIVKKCSIKSLIIKCDLYFLLFFFC